MANEIKGLEELQKKLAKLKGLKDNPKALLAGAYVIERESKEIVPVETGFLRSSIQSEQTDKGAQVRVSANYAYHVEFGTAHSRAQPYIRPVIDEQGNEIVDAVANQLQKDVDAIARGGG